MLSVVSIDGCLQSKADTLQAVKRVQLPNINICIGFIYTEKIHSMLI